MRIETKFDVGDSMWVMFNNKATSIIISSIEIIKKRDCANKKTILTIVYQFDCNGFYRSDENRCFKTKEDLLKSL